MKNKKIILIFLFISISLLIAVHSINSFDCSSLLSGKCFLELSPLIFGYNTQYSIPFIVHIIIFFLLLFLKEAVFKAWLKFAMYSLPIYIGLLWLFTGSGGGPDGFYSSGGYGSASGEFFVLFFSVLYLIISLIFITKKAKKFGGMLELETTMNSKDNLDSFITKKEKMDFSETELIRQAIVSAEGNKSDTEIKETLLEQGFQEKDITKAFDEIKKEETNKK
jgi:hypothetical protein